MVKATFAWKSAASLGGCFFYFLQTLISIRDHAGEAEGRVFSVRRFPSLLILSKAIARPWLSQLLRGWLTERAPGFSPSRTCYCLGSAPIDSGIKFLALDIRFFLC